MYMLIESAMVLSIVPKLKMSLAD